MYQDLKGKKILVTGATRGIGKAIALDLAAHGCHIIYTFRTSDSGAELGRLLCSESTGIQIDLSKTEDIEQIVEPILKHLGSLDGLINNAGISQDKLLMRVKVKDIDHIMHNNLHSSIALTATCSRFLLRGTNPAIVNISSIIGLMGNSAQSLYSASKAGLIGFTKSIARELAAKNVRCNAICPGFISTEMTESLDAELKSHYLSQIPLKRYGNAQEVANLVRFLMSESSSYITGEVIKIDGGLYT